RTDGCVRADIRALVALDTGLGIPGRDGDGDAALLVSGSALLEGAVYMVASECGYRQRVAVHTADRLHDLLDHLDRLLAAFQMLALGLVLCVRPGCRDVDLLERGCTGVDRLVVH